MTIMTSERKDIAGHGSQKVFFAGRPFLVAILQVVFAPTTPPPDFVIHCFPWTSHVLQDHPNKKMTCKNLQNNQSAKDKNHDCPSKYMYLS